MNNLSKYLLYSVLFVSAILGVFLTYYKPNTIRNGLPLAMIAIFMYMLYVIYLAIFGTYEKEKDDAKFTR